MYAILSAIVIGVAMVFIDQTVLPVALPVIQQELQASTAKTHPLSTEKMLHIGNIEVWNDCLNLNPKIDEMVLHPDMIHGFPFMTLIDTIEWKRFMNRDKDLKDIALIEEYLKTNV